MRQHYCIWAFLYFDNLRTRKHFRSCSVHTSWKIPRVYRYLFDQSFSQGLDGGQMLWLNSGVHWKLNLPYI